jgi:oxysterol-binding protein 1
VSSKQDVTNESEEAPSASASASTASLQSQQPQGLHKHQSHHRHASRHRPHLSTTMSPSTGQEQLSPGPGETSASPSSPNSKAVSIEQSVKLFRVFEALRNGDTGAISKAIREEESPPTDTDETSPRLEGTTILHLAIQCAEMPVIEFVLSNLLNGKDPASGLNQRDRDGNTPLHLAASLGRGPVVRLLLDQPNINDSITNYQGQTPLDLARTPEIFQQLQLARSIFVDENVKKIHALVAAGDYQSLEQLLSDSRVQSTLDVNGGELARDPTTVETGGTLLHEAARKKDTKLIQMLLLNGADPFRRDRKGKLPQDVTKDDRTRAILKRSPAAAAAQRGIQEKTILSGAQQPGGATNNDTTLGNKDGREMKGYLKKWTNYTSGYKLRWFVLEDGVLSYYKHQGNAFRTIYGDVTDCCTHR